MKIGIDARLYNQTGVGVYIRNLLYYLQQIQTQQITFFIFLLKKDYQQLSFKKNFIKVCANYRWHTGQEQYQYLKKINQYDLDLMHFTYFSYPILYKRPFIITIHDLTPLHYKTGQSSTKNPFVYELKHYFYRHLISKAVKNSKLIITPTSHVKNQITNHYGQIHSKKIEVTHEGVNHEIIDTKPNQQLQKNFSEPFFIYVGNFYPHKNIGNLIKAFEIINKFRLVLIGPDDYFASRIKEYIKQLGLSDKITICHNIPNQDLVFFYKNARALIFPSISEGFGLPLVEAAYFGCPIIASDIEVFREVMNNNYHKFDQTDIVSIEKTINDFISLKGDKIKIPKLNPDFSFKKMTNHTFAIYQNCMNNTS